MSQWSRRRAMLATASVFGLSGCLGFESADSETPSPAITAGRHSTVDREPTDSTDQTETSVSTSTPTASLEAKLTVDPIWDQTVASEEGFHLDGSRIYTPFRGSANQPSEPSGIRAFNWKTGESLWTANLETSPTAIYAEVANGRLYLSTDETLFAINPTDGSIHASREIGDSRGDPAVVDGTVVIGTNSTDENSLYGLDAETLEQQWSVGHRLELDDGGFAPSGFDGAVATPDRVVAAYRNGRLSAYDPETGDELWVTPFTIAGPEYGPFTDPSGRVVVVESEDRSICRLDPTTGDRQWTLEFETRTGALPPIAQPVFDGNTGWIGAERHLMAFDISSGERHWHVELPGPVGQTLALTERAVWVVVSPADNPRLLAFDRTDGSLRYRRSNPPVVGNLYGSNQQIVISSREQMASYRVQEAANGN